MACVLVTGGAGFIGSHTVLELSLHGHQTVVLDDLSNGYRDAVPAAALAVGRLHDDAFLERLFQKHTFDAVIHFAGLIEAGVSVSEPLLFYDNNLRGNLHLLGAMERHGVKKLIFSSTAAIYGDAKEIPIRENTAQMPVNPYGRSKYMVEQILDDCYTAWDLESVRLRYFNAAGADPKGRLGERHNPESHLIPIILQVAAGQRPYIKIFGNDYETHDGTCVRDYIHVSDLATAHRQALEHLTRGFKGGAYNLGNGKGFSVLEVIEAARSVTGHSIPAHVKERRPGDAPILIADSRSAQDVLAWTPRYPKIQTIIEHAWYFLQEHWRQNG